MESEKIKELLDKYWNCTSSLEEEEQLRNFFRKDEIPPELQKYREMFMYFSDKRENVLDASFDERIMNMIHLKKARKSREFLGAFYKIAAAVLLVLSFFVIHDRFIRVKDQAKKVVQDTFQDPEKALAETKKVLFLMSEKLTMGKAEASRLNKFKKAEEVLKNAKYEEI
jgi:hypothetical protein